MFRLKRKNTKKMSSIPKDIKNIDTFQDVMEKYDPSKNLTRNVMTKFEKTKVIGIRLEQLSRGAIPNIDTTNIKNIREICMKELEERKIPFVIMRPLPNGKKEYWRLKDMIIP